MQRSRYISLNKILLGRTGLKVQSERIKDLQDLQRRIRLSLQAYGITVLSYKQILDATRRTISLSYGSCMGIRSQYCITLHYLNQPLRRK